MEPNAEELARREAWQEADAVLSSFTDEGGECLTILGHPVMESWEQPYMAALATAACEPGGRVLEVGFGLGLSAACIDAYRPSVSEHVILEANDAVLGRAGLWADKASVPTLLLGGFWQDLVPSLEPESFGGILFDAFPLSPGEACGDGEVGAFFSEASRLLRPGGCFTFYYDAGSNWIECCKAFRDDTIPKLLRAGFSKIEEDQVLCRPRPGCTYFWKDRFLVPRAWK